MKYRELGKTNICVSEIGFGTWGIGGDTSDAIGYGPTSDEESKLVLERAFELGINFFDTADLYGFGHSEELVGEVFKGRRKDIVIASKVGFLDFEGKQDFSPDHIRQAIENSLNRLQTDYIDLYQLHSPPIDILLNDKSIMATFASLKREGIIKVAGISVRSPDDGLVAANELDFEAIQLNLNLTDQRALENGLIEFCREKGIGIIVRTPLCFGFLTGEYSATDQFAQHDHRLKWTDQQLNKWANAYKLFVDNTSRIEPSTNAQIALRFCLSFHGVSTVIPGMLTKQQVEENAASSQLGALSEANVLNMRHIYNENSFIASDS